MDAGHKALLNALGCLPHYVRGIALKRGDAHEPSFQGSIRSIGLVGEVYSPEPASAVTPERSRQLRKARSKAYGFDHGGSPMFSSTYTV